MGAGLSLQSHKLGLNELTENQHLPAVEVITQNPDLWGTFHIYFSTTAPGLALSFSWSLPGVLDQAAGVRGTRSVAGGGETDPDICSSQRHSWILPRARSWPESGYCTGAPGPHSKLRFPY